MDISQFEQPKRTTGVTRKICDELHQVLTGMRIKHKISYIMASYITYQYLNLIDKDISGYQKLGRGITTKNISPFFLISIELSKAFDISGRKVEKMIDGED